MLSKGKVLEYCGAAFPAQRVQAGLIHLPRFWKYWANFFKMSHLLCVTLLNLRGQRTKMSSKLKIPLGLLQSWGIDQSEAISRVGKS